MQLPIEISASVAEALANHGPVVALESTIITHGMPAPHNLELARSVEATVRQHGAVPATMALIDGVLRVGLDDLALEGLAAVPAAGEGGATPSVRKLSRADLATAVVQGATGSTTVAATMIVARLTSIEVFATGGIGGVHRGAEHSFDISADLQELARTPVNVVAAGAKAILDLPKTLEVLETLGVPVIGYRTDHFPAFWSRDSGLRAPLRLDHAGEIARSFRMRAALGIPGGQLIANPIPQDAEIPQADLQPVIEEAVAGASAAGIHGKEVTPYLLARVREITRGRSLAANSALVLNNARLAAKIAVALATSEADRDVP